MRLLFVCLTALAALVSGETGIDGWLRYARLPKHLLHEEVLHSIPRSILVLNSTKASPIETAGSELKKGINGILGLDLKVVTTSKGLDDGGKIIVSTTRAYTAEFHALPRGVDDIIEDGFYLSTTGRDVYILGLNERGALYGAFEYLSLLAQGDFRKTQRSSNPDAPIRWTNQWDNLWANGTHGSIERGYGGVSIFYDGVGHVREDLSRVPLLGRLLASIGINAAVINNVNADASLLNDANLEGVGRIAGLLRPWGVQVGLSQLFNAPQSFGGLDSYDPLDPKVAQWWRSTTDMIYKHVPDLAGYLIKASSEGQPGPLSYNRTLADGANVFARALKPHGGTVMFRAFVYNQFANEDDWHADRANAAVQFFDGLDGKFDDNVVVQIKHGPIDFQVREAVSPLFTHLRETDMAVELQITQEYLGQQCHLVYLAPMWKEYLDFDMRIDSKPSLLRDIIAGRVTNRKRGGYVGVANLGMNDTWLGSNLAMSNLYAFGRLAWDPRRDAADVLAAWTRLTFGPSRAVVDAVAEMAMLSWPAYENYTGNLGIQTLTDILYTHYGPNPASQDGNGWGQWTRADGRGIGMDRTVANGTGNAGQYPPEVAARYESTATTPDNLMLWFHHVPYTFRLHLGSSVIQHFYDAHYAGAAAAQTLHETWAARAWGEVDAERFEHELLRLKYQAGHALVWRDAVCGFYHNLSGIADARGRVRHHPWRIEAEDMALEGFRAVAVTPPEAASGRTAVATNGTGTARAALRGFAGGTYSVAVNYFDVTGGVAAYELAVGGRVVGKWKGDAEYKLGKFPSQYLDGHSAIRVTFPGVRIARGDELVVRGVADGAEQAALDYVSILPPGTVD